LNSAIRFRSRYDTTDDLGRILPVQEAGYLALVEQPHLGSDAITDFVTEYRGTDVLAERHPGFPKSCDRDATTIVARTPSPSDRPFR
jgi:hypothetical protein